MAKSLRGAINAKCRECSYDPKGVGTWRMQVEACLVTECPLYPVRPLSKFGREAEKNGQEGAIAALSTINL